MLQEKMREVVRMSGLGALVLGAAMASAGCGDDDEECAAANPGITQGYLISQAYQPGQQRNYLSDSDCGPGCELIGETEEQYCCWCKD